MQNPYDEVPYGEFVHPSSHPGRAAAVATLLGLSPKPLDHCRVLELGCASGSNLLPLAVQFPQSQFVGVDYSPRQIQSGQAWISRLGLSNIALHALDIRQMDETFGSFDYIVAHGLYSWVPADVREHAMQLCKRLLSPSGIIYMSYNTYPGWRMLQMAREAMVFHTRHITDPQQRAQQGRDFVQFLAQVPPTDDTLWGTLMGHYKGVMEIESRLLHGKPLNDLLHDELEAVNEPCYFTDFIEHAGQHGLQYLSEVNFAHVMVSNLPKEAAERLQQMTTTLVEREQYIDFVCNRAFRETLLVHADAVLNRRLEPRTLASLFISSSAAPGKLSIDEYKPGAQKYVAPDKVEFVTADPFIQTMFDLLIAHAPMAFRLDDLAAQVMALMAQRLPRLPTQAELQQHLAGHALLAYTRSSGLIDLQAHAPQFTTTIGERPSVSALTHAQLKQGMVVTTARHENVVLDSFTRTLASLLDGTRTLEALQEAIVSMTLSESRMEAQSLRMKVEQQLKWLAHNALLVS